MLKHFKSKKALIALVIILFVLAVSGGAFFVYIMSTQNQSSESIVQTEDEESVVIGDQKVAKDNVDIAEGDVSDVDDGTNKNDADNSTNGNADSNKDSTTKNESSDSSKKNNSSADGKTEKQQTKTPSDTKKDTTTPNSSPSSPNTSDTKTNDAKNDDQKTETPKVEDENKCDELRNELEKAYGVTIKYKDEMGDYQVAFKTPTKLYDEDEIYTYLGEIEKTFSKYPSGFFNEMSSYNMPLTIYMYKSIGGDLRGLTDSQFMSNIIISIETDSAYYSFERVLHHELMHYIDNYISVRYYPVDIEATMAAVNPSGFVYGGVDSTDFVYNYSNPTTAYFVTSYAKTNYREDRAELFADLMFRAYKLSCHQSGTPINEKAKLLASQLDKYFESVSSSTTEHWEKMISQ